MFDNREHTITFTVRIQKKTWDDIRFAADSIAHGGDTLTINSFRGSVITIRT
jgi:hypothetical protein